MRPAWNDGAGNGNLRRVGVRSDTQLPRLEGGDVLLDLLGWGGGAGVGGGDKWGPLRLLNTLPYMRD